MENEKYNTIPMIEKACRVVDIISQEGGETGISQIARKTGYSKSTIFRILYTLQSWNWIEKDEATDKYRLGLFFLQAGKQVKSMLNLEDVARPIMKQLVEETGESVNLGVLFENRVLIAETVSGQKSLLVRGLQPVFDLYCSGMGKLFLSQMSEDELHEYFTDTEIVKRTSETIITEADMKKEISIIQKEGYSADKEEYEYGLYCIAVPIKNNEGKIIAGLSVSGPVSRMEKGHGLTEIRKYMLAGAREVERRMGYNI
ncbi:MAG: IclR family transcriptional regulator [Anaerovoracaceae bacterium]